MSGLNIATISPNLLTKHLILRGIFQLKANFNSNLASQQPDSLAQKLDQLVEDHYDYLFSYAYRYFRSDDKSSDLVQETFLAVTESFSRFEGRSSIRTWLTGILRNKIMDSLRRNNREEQYDFSSEDSELNAKVFDEVEHWRDETGPKKWSCPDSVFEQKEFLKAMDLCLSKLPSHVRQIFLLREMDGLKRDEICKQFDLSPTNVGVLLYRARVSLQHCLQANWLTHTKLCKEKA